MTMKPEYKTLKILEKGNDYLINLANPANIKICVKKTALLKVLNLVRLLHEDIIKINWFSSFKSDWLSPLLSLENYPRLYVFTLDNYDIDL